MGRLEGSHFVSRLVVSLATLASVCSQCTEPLKTCSNGLCDGKECETNVTNNAVEAIVAIMSVSVVLIIGLVMLLVYICLKQGSRSQNSDSTNDSNMITCENTAIEIPDYLLRRRFSSLSTTSGPPPYFSLFNFICNENGEILNTVIGQNFRTENLPRLPSTSEQPPEYGVLFGTPPPYDVVVLRSESATTGFETQGDTRS